VGGYFVVVYVVVSYCIWVLGLGFGGLGLWFGVIVIGLVVCVLWLIGLGCGRLFYILFIMCDLFVLLFYYGLSCALRL